MRTTVTRGLELEVESRGYAVRVEVSVSATDAGVELERLESIERYLGGRWVPIELDRWARADLERAALERLEGEWESITAEIHEAEASWDAEARGDAMREEGRRR